MFFCTPARRPDLRGRKKSSSGKTKKTFNSEKELIVIKSVLPCQHCCFKFPKFCFPSQVKGFSPLLICRGYSCTGETQPQGGRKMLLLLFFRRLAREARRQGCRQYVEGVKRILLALIKWKSTAPTSNSSDRRRGE